MKALVLILSILIATKYPSKANMDCQWSATKSGITVHYISSCREQAQQFLETFLSKLVQELGHHGRNIKILLIVNGHSLSFPENQLPTFISIGFDTLRMIDDDFIFKYYTKKEDSAMGPTGGLNTFESKNNPLDINATHHKTTNQLGIKIFYNSGYGMNKTKWDELEKLTLYAAKNFTLIKTNQTKQIIRYNTNGWFVSINSINTKIIETLLNRELIKKKPEPSFLTKILRTLKAQIIATIFVGLFYIVTQLHLFS